MLVFLVIPVKRRYNDSRRLYCVKGEMKMKALSYNIILIGFMGTGKSAVSHYMHEEYGMELVEMDEFIEEREGMSIQEMFKVHGEEYFRRLETNLLTELQEAKNTVVSCGGGAPMREENVRAMKKSGKVVLLTARAETILERVKESEARPLLNGNKNIEFIEGLLEKRRDKYKTAADVTIATDGKSVAEICAEIMEKIS